MFCRRCGAEFSQGKFCPKCGAPLAENNNSEEKTVLTGESESTTAVVSEETTAIKAAEETVAESDFYGDETVAAKEFSVGNTVNAVESEGGAQYPYDMTPLDPKAAKKANRKPMSTKKKVLVAISSVLAFIIVLGSVAVGIVAFVPKFKFIAAAYNTLLNTKSFDLNIVLEDYYFRDFEDGDSHYLRDYNGEDWKFESGSCATTTRREIKTSYCFGESDEDTQMYSVTEYSEEMSGSGYGKILDSEDYNDYIRIDSSKFRSSYSVICAGELINGSVSGEGDYAHDGSFSGGNVDAYYEYIKKNNDSYVPLAKNKRINPEYLSNYLEMIMSSGEGVKELSVDEWKKIIYDIFSLALKEGAVEITDTRLEDGMTKYEIKINPYKFDVCRRDYADKNDDYKDYLKSKKTYDGLTEYHNLKKLDRDDYSDSFEFTVGTKGMRFVHFKYEEEDYSGADKSSRLLEINITNINKKKDYSSQHRDIKAIAEEWKENYTYCTTANEFEAYYKKDEIE